MTDFQFKPAKRENVKLLISLAGASGSGKTKTALEIAMGLSPSGRIAVIDTEADRALHYAGEYSFMHAGMSPPFRPSRFEEGVIAAEKSGAEVLIVDSFSHEYAGEGGIMDWADELAEGTPKPGITNPRTDKRDKDWWKDWLKKPVPGPGNWKEPKLAHKEMVNKFLQAHIHLIFCLRAEEKIKIIEPTAENGYKTQIVPLGWMPIAEKRFAYEMTLSFTLDPSDPGKPKYNLPHKVQDQHRPFFPEGRYISREAGAKLAAWAHGEPEFNVEAFLNEATIEMCHAESTAETLSSWWNSAETVAKRKQLASADRAKSAKLIKDVDGTMKTLKELGGE